MGQNGHDITERPELVKKYLEQVNKKLKENNLPELDIDFNSPKLVITPQHLNTFGGSQFLGLKISDGKHVFCFPCSNGYNSFLGGYFTYESAKKLGLANEDDINWQDRTKNWKQEIARHKQEKEKIRIEKCEERKSLKELAKRFCPSLIKNYLDNKSQIFKQEKIKTSDPTIWHTLFNKEVFDEVYENQLQSIDKEISVLSDTWLSAYDVIQQCTTANGWVDYTNFNIDKFYNNCMTKNSSPLGEKIVPTEDLCEKYATANSAAIMTFSSKSSSDSGNGQEFVVKILDSLKDQISSGENIKYTSDQRGESLTESDKKFCLKVVDMISSGHKNCNKKLQRLFKLYDCGELECHENGEFDVTYFFLDPRFSPE
jgi:hypothetical protein